MPGNVLFRNSLLFLILLPISFLWFFPQVLRCMYIIHSEEFSLLAPNSQVYISRTATASERIQLSQHTKTARERIRRFWGSRQGQATLIYCPNQEDYTKYCAGGEGAGCSIGTPWGTSYLILGPDGNNADVIAHELCHDELFARLGWWRVKREIPQWFNEGLALMVDYRFSTPSVWEQADSLTTSGHPFTDEPDIDAFAPQPMLALRDLESTREFFGGDYSHTMLAYETAASEVTRWLAAVGRAGVPSLTQAILNGADFYPAYRQLEHSKRKRY